VLVSRDESNNFTAKVADFGFSNMSMTQGLVYMPKSGVWTAPEWHHRGFSFASAMKMDVYSFGVLSLWLLLYISREDGSQTFYEYLASNIHRPLDLEISLMEAFEKSDDKKRSTVDLFNLTLALEPNNRTSDMETCISILTGKPLVTSALPQGWVLTMSSTKNSTTSNSMAEPKLPLLCDFQVGFQIQIPNLSV